MRVYTVSFGQRELCVVAIIENEGITKNMRRTAGLRAARRVCIPGFVVSFRKLVIFNSFYAFLGYLLSFRNR